MNPRRLRPGRPPAVLLGRLNTMWALGMASIGSVVAASDEHRYACASRFAVGQIGLPARLHPPDAAVAALVRAGRVLSERAGCRLPLFCGSDDPLRLLYLHREALSPHYTFLLSDTDLGLALLDKERFATLCRSLGLPVPRTFARDADDELRRADFPLIVKPRAKTDWHASRVYRELFGSRGKARVVTRGRELFADPLLAALRQELVVQEYVPGGDDRIVSFHGLADERGEVMACFAGRKLRTFPEHTGESTFLELVHDEELLALGRATVKTLGLRGPCKIDFKRHAETGRAYMMEINARFTLWNHLGAANGVNIPVAAYEYLVNGTRSACPSYATRYRWLRLRLDFRAYRELASRGELSFARWARSIVCTRKVYYLFSWTDPKPFFARCGEALRRGVGAWRATGSSRTSTAIRKR